MRSFFRKNKTQVQKEGKESSVSATDMLNESDEVINVAEDIDTDLSIHPSWDVPEEQGYVYRFMNNELAPLKPNQISLAPIELHKDENGQLIAIAFVRNSLAKPITFEEVTLLLLDSEQQPIARNEFNMAELGELPGRSSRPWQFIFPVGTIMQDEYNTNDWTLAFEIKPKHSLDLEESWNSSLSTEDKEKLRNLVDDLTPPKEGEVNFMGMQASKRENGDLHVTVLIRNGSPKNITIQQLPLQVTDAKNEIVAKGGFQLNDLEVKANTTKPWTFIFPANILIKDDMDLSTWKIATVQEA
ncbi:accessory Sec system S-layer assembly protein [Bacillus sp. 1P06AnD]|uniref:accessory Sec system S-layer assembly protein n=1 Tax=Bacillus sp. 1P06AnD TaxID=3132208 RepID=UPI0039A37295